MGFENVALEKETIMHFGAMLKTFIYVISSSLLYPVLFFLVLLCLLMVLFAGMFFAEWLDRARTQRIMPEAFTTLTPDEETGQRFPYYVRRYYTKLWSLIHQSGGVDPLHVENLLQQENLNLMKTVDRLKIIVRVGPSLGLMGTLFFVKDLNILMIGEETAANLGVNIRLARNMLLLAASVQTGGAIAVSGVIGFVGLLAPHMVRGLIGPDNRKLIPLAGLLGAVFVIYADLFVRLVVQVDLKIGVLTSLMGGPFFLYLIIRYRNRFEYL